MLARPSRSRDMSTSPVPAPESGPGPAAGDSLAGWYSCGGGHPPWPDRRSRSWWIQVDGQGRVAGSGPSSPGPGQQLPAHPIQLADVAPPEAAQERPQRGWRLDYSAESAGRPAGAQHVGVVDAVAARQR